MGEGSRLANLSNSCHLIATLGLHPGFSAKLGICPVPACKMEPQHCIIMVKHQPTHPPAAHLFLTDIMAYHFLKFWGCLEGVLEVSWDYLEGVLRVSEGCLDSVRRVSWVSLHVLCLQIFDQSCKTEQVSSCPDMSGWNGIVLKILSQLKNFGLWILLEPNLFWMKKNFGQIFFVLSFYFPSFFFQYCHTRAPSWIFSLAENLGSSSIQDGAMKWHQT